jgi:tRNA A37 threonylcarbamoyladenosine dehydratase
MNAWDQRFGGIERLYGKRASQKIRDGHVCVIGIGGVGSWAAESLARTGIGKLTLVDMDEVCVTNVNRQVPAVDGEVGQLKVEAMARRIALISPECDVQAKAMFFTQSTADSIFEESYDIVIDAIDRLNAKCLLLSMSKQKGLAVVCTGAAGGRVDPFKIETADLSRVHHDRLLQKVRKQLRADYGFPRSEKIGIPCVFSPETARGPWDLEDACDTGSKTDRPGQLGCADGYGSATHVTGSFGFAAASLAIQSLTCESI